MNGKIKRSHQLAGRYTIAVRSNDVGEAIQQLMEEFNLFAVNTKFKPRNNQKTITYKKGKFKIYST